MLLLTIFSTLTSNFVLIYVGRKEVDSKFVVNHIFLPKLALHWFSLSRKITHMFLVSGSCHTVVDPVNVSLGEKAVLDFFFVQAPNSSEIHAQWTFLPLPSSPFKDEKTARGFLLNTSFHSSRVGMMRNLCFFWLYVSSKRNNKERLFMKSYLLYSFI